MRTFRLLLIVLMVLTSILSSNTSSVLADHHPFEDGDLFVGVEFPAGIQHLAPNGTVLETLTTSDTPDTTAGLVWGMAFDPAGNLYAALMSQRAVAKYDSNGALVSTIRTDDPPASVALDADGDLYVGTVHLAGTTYRATVAKYDANGNRLFTYFPEPGTNEGIFHMELAGDQCTLFYSFHEFKIKRFDVCTNQQLPDFATLPTFLAGGFQLLFDGGLLIAAGDSVYRLDRNANIIRIYPLPVVADSSFEDLVVTVDGKAFWTSDWKTSNVYKFSIETGAQLAVIHPTAGNHLRISERLALFNQSCAFLLDCDADGLSNADEVTIIHTDPYNKDTDGDGLLDSWEADPDPDGDGTLIPGAGFNLDSDPEIEVMRDSVFGPYFDDNIFGRDVEFADGRHPESFPKFVGRPDPLHKDIYFELDWQDCSIGGCPDDGWGLDNTHHAPSAEGIAKVREAFTRSPVENPDGSRGINLHILIDEAVNHTPICDQNQSSVRAAYFGTPWQRAATWPDGNHSLAAKARSFRYIWSGHSTEHDDTDPCVNPPFSELRNAPLPFYDYSPFGDAHVGGSDILVSLGPLWICPSFNTTFGATTCFKHDGWFSEGIFPAKVFTEDKSATRRFDWPLHSIIMEDDTASDPEKAAIAQIWSRTLMHLIGHSLGIADDQVVRNDPRIYSADGVLIGREPELYTSWHNLKYAPVPDNPGSETSKEAYPPHEVVQSQDYPGYPGMQSVNASPPFYHNLDIDGDTIIDGIDNCLMGIENTNQADLDYDGRGDACDYDIDQDGQLNAVGQNIPDNADPFPYDTNNDGVNNSTSTDDDADSVADTSDNCRFDANSSQVDTDGDAIGDACDSDDDNDTFIDARELDTGSDPLSNASTPEYVGETTKCSDGIDNDRDDQTDSADPGCGDTDNDTRADGSDNCPNVANYGWSDQDNDGIGDACDATPLPPNTAPSVSIGGPYSVDEGGTVEITATGSDAESSALNYLWDLNNDGTFGSLGQPISLSTTDLKLDGPGTHPIAVQVIDEGDLTATTTTTVTVRNLAPVASPITTSKNPVMATSLIMTSANFTDAGIRDTHTAVWDWGDGTTSVGAVNEMEGAGSVKGSHVYTSPGRYTVKLTVTDNDHATSQPIFQEVVVNPAPNVRFSAVNYRVLETVGNTTLTVTLDAVPTEPVMVKYASSDGTATAGSDYTATSGTLSFAPGETSKTFTVRIENDTADESDETVNLTLSAPWHASLGTPSAVTITIEDEDTVPNVTFDVSRINVHENIGSANVVVELKSASNNTVTIDYATSDGTATAGTDYTATSGTLAFAPGEMRKSFTVPILDDAAGEANETVTLSLSNPVNAILGTPATATLTIYANDILSFTGNIGVQETVGTATVTVKMNAPSSNPVTVDYATGDGTATAGSDYTATSGTLTFAPGETTKTFTIPIFDDAAGEANETVTLSLSNPTNAGLSASPTATLTIYASDTLTFSGNVGVHENADAALMTVRLNGPSDLPVTVDYTTGDGTATAGSDYTATSGTLSFAPGETTKTFTVPILDDMAGEANETVTLSLSNATNAVLGTPSSATLTINANDTLSFNGNVNVHENADTATMTVKLSGPSDSSVTVDYATSNGTATAGSDYTTTSGTLTFAPGETSKTFTVPILDDTAGETNETIILSLSNPTNAVLATSTSATLTINANDMLSFSGNVNVHENADTATITVRLNTASDVPVTVDYTTSDGTATAGSDYTATSGTLSFAPGETTKTFTIPILDDAAGEANESVTLSLSNPTNAGLGTVNTATLTIYASDTLSLSGSSYRVNESSSSATITVKLSGPSDSSVTVDYATSDGTATAGSDYTATSGTLIFAPGETTKTFAVPFINDTVDEPNETVTVTISNPSNAVLGTPTTAPLTIVDND